MRSLDGRSHERIPSAQVEVPTDMPVYLHPEYQISHPWDWFLSDETGHIIKEAEP